MFFTSDKIINVRILLIKRRDWESSMHKKWIIILILAVTIGGISLAVWHGNQKNEHKTAEKNILASSKSTEYDNKNSADSSTNTSNNQSTSTAEQKETTTAHNQELVKQTLVGKGYDVLLVKYNDVDVDKAMAMPGTPQNLVHDGTCFYYFDNDSTYRAKPTAAGNSVGSASGTWTVNDHNITLTMDAGAQRTIPYQIENNEVEFMSWDLNYNGNKLTYNFIPDSSAKAYIERKQIQY